VTSADVTARFRPFLSKLGIRMARFIKNIRTYSESLSRRCAARLLSVRAHSTRGRYRGDSLEELKEG